eukprot:scaffold5362_cov67-Phaeocystis_antarctica.AAC.3
MWTWCERLVAPRTHARSALTSSEGIAAAGEGEQVRPGTLAGRWSRGTSSSSSSDESGEYEAGGVAAEAGGVAPEAPLRPEARGAARARARA